MLEKKETLENGQLVLTIHVGMEEWKNALDNCYLEAAELNNLDKNISRAELEKQYGNEFLYQEAVNASYPVALEEILNKDHIRFIGSPELKIISIGPEGYSFSATLDLFPDVPEFNYKGLDAVMPDYSLTDTDREQCLKNFLQANPPVTHPEEAAMGDEVVLDFDGSVDGVHFDGGKAEKYPLVLGSGYFIEGFEPQVVGMKVGDERDINVTFPQQYEPSLAGKAAVFHIKVHEIRRRGTEMTEEYAKALGYDSVDALKESIINLTAAQKKQFARDTVGMTLASQVAREIDIDIPETAITQQLDSMINQMASQLQAQGASMADYLKANNMTEEALRAQYRENALTSIRAAIILAEIVQRENISVSDEAINAEYASLQKQYNVAENMIRKQLPPDALRRELALRSARDLLINSANLTPKA